MIQQIADVKAAVDALNAKTDELVTVNNTLVALAGTLKDLLDKALQGALSLADQQALTTTQTELAAVQAKLQGVVQVDTDTNATKQPGN